MTSVTDDQTTQDLLDAEQRGRVGAFALKAIASLDGLLFDCVTAVEGQPSGTQGRQQVAELSAKLPSAIIDRIVSATHVPANVVLELAVDQLKRVARFARSDGGDLSDNLKAVERLIRSGRLDLFSR